MHIPLFFGMIGNITVTHLLKKATYTIVILLTAYASHCQTFEAALEPTKVVVVEGDTQTRKYQKSIWVSFVIRSSGDIGAINIIGSDKPDMNDKLTKALKGMFWTPAVHNGKAVATIGDFTFYFQ